MEYIQKMQIIRDNLEKCKRITRHSTTEENQADTLANALIDIEESIQRINEQIPKLYLKILTENEVDDLILDIGEELRHVLYHINDTRVYDYLKMDAE